MPDSSPNVLRPGSVPQDHTAPVLREIGELMALERELGRPRPPGEEFAEYKLSLSVLERELPYARTIPQQGQPGDARYKQWVLDRQKAEEIFRAYRTFPKPSMPTPTTTRLPGDGSQPPHYQFYLPGKRLIADIEADDVPKVLPSILRPYEAEAFYEALPPVRVARIEIRTILARWGIWDIRTEAALVVSDFNQENVDQFLGKADGEIAYSALPDQQEEVEDDDPVGVRELLD